MHSTGVEIVGKLCVILAKFHIQSKSRCKLTLAVGYIQGTNTKRGIELTLGLSALNKV